MTVYELICRLEKIKEKDKEIFVAHDEEDGEDILNIEESDAAIFIIYQRV